MLNGRNMHTAKVITGSEAFWFEVKSKSHPVGEPLRSGLTAKVQRFVRLS